MRLKVSVIIPTLNEEKLIGNLLKSLKTQTVPPHEIIVVDGGSKDQTVQICKAFSCKVIEASGTLGATRNIGAKAASGNILAFIDADCTVSCRWVERIVETFTKNKDVVGVVGGLYPTKGEKIDKLAFTIMRSHQRLSIVMNLPFNSSINCAYRKEEFEKVKGFDATLEYNEGTMFSLRIGKLGLVVFNRKMKAFTSLRRVKKYGYLYMAIWYTINMTEMLLTTKTMKYSKVR